MDNQNSKTAQWVSISIIIASLIISGAVLYASSKKGSGTANSNQQNNPQNLTPPAKASIDDDAVLGDKNAPVTMIEFSDYECPFCKRHFTEVYPELKKNYIDTGKVKLVFRDFIAVTSHNPLATSEAMAAECAGELGGDSAYFKYHDEIFKRTTSNGNGLQLSQLPIIATSIGLNVTKFQQCVDSNKYRNEIERDQQDGKAAGVSGTPSFVIGKSTANGMIDGKLVVGAVPFSDASQPVDFKRVIDAALAEK